MSWEGILGSHLGGVQCTLDVEDYIISQYKSKFQRVSEIGDTHFMSEEVTGSQLVSQQGNLAESNICEG